jgi:hypothetical protein
MAMRRKVAVLVLAAGLMNGCASWRYIPNERAASTIKATNPTRVRFTLSDSTVEVVNPSIVNDSLVGTVQRGDVEQKASFALNSLDSLSVSSMNNRTAGWIFGGAWAVLMTATLIGILTVPATETR